MGAQFRARRTGDGGEGAPVNGVNLRDHNACLTMTWLKLFPRRRTADSASATSESTSSYNACMCSATAAELIANLHQLFLDADEDNSGHLDTSELAALFRRVYRVTGVARSTSVVQQEVDAAIRRYYRNGDGHIDFNEFIAMFCKDKAFKFQKVPASVKQQVLRTKAYFTPADILRQYQEDMPCETLVVAFASILSKRKFEWRGSMH